jgi:uncharacterized protein YukE
MADISVGGCVFNLSSLIQVCFNPCSFISPPSFQSLRSLSPPLLSFLLFSPPPVKHLRLPTAASHPLSPPQVDYAALLAQLGSILKVLQHHEESIERLNQISSSIKLLEARVNKHDDEIKTLKDRSDSFETRISRISSQVSRHESLWERLANADVTDETLTGDDEVTRFVQKFRPLVRRVGAAEAGVTELRTEMVEVSRQK